MPAAKNPYVTENFWLDNYIYFEAEDRHFAGKALINNLKNTPKAMEEIRERFETIEKDQKQMKSQLDKFSTDVNKQLKNISDMLMKLQSGGVAVQNKSAGGDSKPAAAAEAKKDDNDDDIDLFGSDDEEESAEAAKIREERLAKYAAKKSKKPGPIAKSSVLLDVKPWDDETNMKELEIEVRKIEMDGMIWSQQAKLVPLAYGIKKLQIGCVVEDEKVSIEELQEKIEEIENYVQSVDVAAFNKI